MLTRPSDKVVSVIPIFGMPGLGKTTLAKSVYNDPKIKEPFGKMVWVWVGKKINIVELFKLILETLNGAKVELDNMEVTIQQIKSKLEGKRCFLVLDDVWNQEKSLWDEFFNTLKKLKPTNGSWCLVTTRLEGVANAMSGHLGMNGPYKLQNLSDDDCWSIIERNVPEEIPQEMKEQILERCGGLPLAATLFGSLLARGKEMWPSIMQKSLLDGDQNDEHKIPGIIKVSFDHLSPAAVKKCFAYCSIFPQDTRKKKDRLIELWMAEGFLQPDHKNERLMMEEIGDDYLRILLGSSLLEEVEEWGETHYKMHDLVHDFAKSALNEDRYRASNSSQGTVDIMNEKTTPLRTLFLESSISSDDLSKFKCLHVLKLSGNDIKVLPGSVGELIHLRILDISDSAITILPESLCKLYNLQTLRIWDGKLQEGLPKQMSNLICLRHLHYYDHREEFQMPSKMGWLIHLQTLMFFNVGREDGRGIEELGNLKDLKGSLEIRNLELVNGKEGAEAAKLFEKCNLSKLIFLWSSGDRECDNRDEHVLEGLQPHPKLQKLRIRNFMGDHFPGWFINLSTLVSLVFSDCENCSKLPGLGQLPSLESLKLKGLKNMTSIEFSFYGVSSGSGQVRECFPSLKYLLLENMENLKEWKDEDEVEVGSTTGAVEVNLFPVLERLDIEGCSRLISAPRHFPSIEVICISNYCHVSLLERSVSNITTRSSLELNGDMTITSDNDEHVEYMCLKKRRHINNSEGDVEYQLEVRGRGVPGEMLERLCHLPGIQHLELINLSNQQLIFDECDGRTSLLGKMLKSCISLQELEIYDCNEFTSLSDKMLQSCSSLQNLEISQCNGLISLPGEMLQSCSSLQNLKISDCNGLTSLPGKMLQSCSSLQNLEISYCNGLTSLPGEMLQSCSFLQNLKIFKCDGLTSLPGEMLESCASLEILNLSNCPKLMIADMSKGFAFLTSLRTLFIGPFSINETNEEFDWSVLTTSSSSSTLTFLVFFGLPHVESLPEQLQYFTSLTELSLEGFGIEALPDWIGNLGSLEWLCLQRCGKLRCLPSVAVRRRLSKLRFLVIYDCPLLEERYMGDTNSEWPIEFSRRSIFRM